MEGLITSHQINYNDREKQIQQRGISSLLNSGRLDMKVIISELTTELMGMNKRILDRQ